MDSSREEDRCTLRTVNTVADNLGDTENVARVAEIWSAEYRGVARAEQYVEWAQEMLARGYDSPSLLRLAVQDPPFFTPDIKHLFDQALGELHIEPVRGPQALVLHAQRIARELLSGAIAPRTASAELAKIFTIDLAPPGCRDWQLLDEADWCEYCAQRFAGDGQTLEDAILERAETLLRADWRTF